MQLRFRRRDYKHTSIVCVRLLLDALFGIGDMSTCSVTLVLLLLRANIIGLFFSDPVRLP